MASRSSADKLKPLPPDPDRHHQHSAIPLTEKEVRRVKEGVQGGLEEAVVTAVTVVTRRGGGGRPNGPCWPGWVGTLGLNRKIYRTRVARADFPRQESVLLSR